MKKSEQLKYLILFALPIIVVFSIVLIAHFPGILVSDALVQWNEVQTGVYDNWHPIFNTLYIALLAGIINNPGFVLAVQILWIAFSVSYFLTRFKKYYNVSSVLLIIISCVFALFPLNFNFAVTLLKDILYSCFILILTGMIVDIINNEDWFKKWYNILFFVLICFAICAFRHNGIIAIVLVFITLFIVKKNSRKYVLITSLIWIVSYFLLNALVMKVFNVEKATYANTYGPVSHIFARMLNSGDEVKFSEEEINELSKYVDVDKLKETYSQYNMDYSINSQYIDVLKENGGDYLKFAIKEFAKYPQIVIKHYLKLSSYLYSPVPFKEHYFVGMFTETDLWIYKDVYPELDRESLLPKVYNFCKNVETELQSGVLGTIFMYPAIWMYLSIILVILVCKKYKNKKFLLLLLPMIYNTLSLVIAIPVPMVRYIYPTLMISYLLIPVMIYLLIKKEKLKLEEKKESI